MFTWNACMIEIEINKAGAVLQKGGSILYPTDTIWGIGCDATNQEAVRDIYRIKQRIDSKSMLVLVNGVSMLEEYIDDLPLQALDIINKAAKPTTIIYPGARRLANNLLAPDGSIGIRITSDPFCSLLIDYLSLPIVSTSANISGQPAPGTFHQIKNSIRDQVDHIVNWRQDEASASTPSAIIKLEEDGTIITLRS